MKENTWWKSQKFFWMFGALILLLTGCETNQAIVSSLTEKEANIILVLLESKGIPATKIKSSSGSEIGGTSGSPKYQIMVGESHTITAISILNQNGFPKSQGTTLLQLFAKQGLMSSDKEETIRYQAGLAQQLTNTILTMDGVIDATVQLSFPPTDLGPGQMQTEKITASIYVKHQGLFDDPNLHLDTKIKRYISGAVTGLDINNVTVVTDRSRFTDISLDQSAEKLSAQGVEYVSIWSIIMNKQSASRFRMLFIALTTIAVLLALISGWVLWKFYPAIKKKGGLKELLNPLPIGTKQESKTPPPNENK
ncbi:MAG: EscJ/YscJ/HrcJ family type III secretion inner membrane ring protein [Simkaniaceae bacterium]|nr:EscJ/YscJ/HrcJ family type III secretion inner membrane ring protein [Simkaniaceae bacterium]